MAAKKKKKKKATKKKDAPKKKRLLEVEDCGRTADGKGHLYSGTVGDRKIGDLAAPNMTTARKRFAALVRKQL